MSDLFLVQFGDDDERARQEAERAAGYARVRARYGDRLKQLAGLDDLSADLMMAVLFDHVDDRGEPCRRGHHPRLPDDGEWSHDAGFDCPCTWDSERREREHQHSRARWEAWRDSPESRALQAEADQERRDVRAWLAAHPGVSAERTVLACPEVWEGTIDGRSFAFRERDGSWRIELDLVPNGQVANRIVGTTDAGEMITEAVELRSGVVIAEGCETSLGTGAVAHLWFIVDTVRTHLGCAACVHPRAERYCPECGTRVGRGT